MRKIGWAFLLVTLVIGAGANLVRGQKAEVAVNEKPELKLVNLMREELELAEGVEVIMSMVEIPPETSLPKHHHPGEEFVYVMEGSATAWLKDQPEVHLKQGDVFKVPLGQIHTAMTGKEAVKLMVFRVHKKGEPERILVE